MDQKYAIIKSGGKQYQVKEDDFIDVELLDGDIGSSIQFKDILFISGDDSQVGGPFVSGYVVTGEIMEIVQGEKIHSVKYIPGNHYRKFGHRQKYSRIKITGISKEKEEKGKGGKHGT